MVRWLLNISSLSDDWILGGIGWRLFEDIRTIICHQTWIWSINENSLYFQFRSFNFLMFNKNKWTLAFKSCFFVCLFFTKTDTNEQKETRKKKKTAYWTLKRSFYPKHTTLFGMSFTWYLVKFSFWSWFLFVCIDLNYI